MSPTVALTPGQVTRFRRMFQTDLEELIWITDWLVHLNMFRELQVCDIITFIQPDIERLVKLRQHASLELTELSTLAVCDSRWVSMSGKNGFLDTESSTIVPCLPEFCVTHIVCDINALFKRMQFRAKRIDKLTGTQNPWLEDKAKTAGQL